MITYRFIENARYHMGSLGFKPKKIEDFNLDNLKQQTIEKIFRLKNSSDAFYLNLHYSWVVRHWNKLLKAIYHEKWQLSDFPYTPLDVSLGRYKYDNVSFITNMFDKTIQCFYIDENDNISSFSYDKKNKKDKHSDFQIIDDKPNNESYIFTNKYLNTLNKHESADPEKAVAVIEKNCLDYKNNKYLFYITYMLDNISKEKINNLTAKDIIKSINRAIEIKNIMATNQILMMWNMNRNI